MVLCLQRLGKFGPLRCGEMYALDRLLRETRVLEIIRRITTETPQLIRQPAEGNLCCLFVCMVFVLFFLYWGRGGGSALVLDRSEWHHQHFPGHMEEELPLIIN